MSKFMQYLDHRKNTQEGKRYTSDSLADTFQNAANSVTAQGPDAILYKTAMGGFAAGARNVGDQRRNAEIEKLEQEGAQIGDMTKQLELQQGEQQLRQGQLATFVKSNTINFSNLADAIKQGDQSQVEFFGNRLLQNYCKTTGENLRFDNVRNGKIFFEDLEGTSGATGIVEFLMEAGSDPSSFLTVDQIKAISGGSAAGQMAISKIEGELAKSQGELAKSQGYSLDNQEKMMRLQDSSSPENKELIKMHMKDNKEYLSETRKVIQEKSLDIKLKVLDRLQELISQDPDIGSTPANILNRYLRKVAGTDADIQEITNYAKYFFAEIKGVAGNPNQKEWDDLVSRIINPSMNREAALKLIAREKENASGFIANYKASAKVIGELGYTRPFDDPEVQDRIRQELEGGREGRPLVSQEEYNQLQQEAQNEEAGQTMRGGNSQTSKALNQSTTNNSIPDPFLEFYK